MATIGEVIGGAKLRSVEDSEEYWSDPLIEYDFYSVTRMPVGTNFEEDQEEAVMLDKIKLKKYKGSDLSDYTKQKFKDENIAYEDDQGEDKP